MGSSSRSSAGPALSALGGLGLLLALSAPFYEFTIPSTLLDRIDGAAAQFGVLGPYLRQGTGYLRDHGPVAVSAWHAFEKMDVALAVVAVIAFGLSLLALTGRADNAGNAISAGALVALGLVGYRMFARPLPAEVISLGWGAYTALACAAAMLAGGRLLARADTADHVRADAAPDPAPWLASPAQRPGHPVAGSVAPPSS